MQILTPPGSLPQKGLPSNLCFPSDMEPDASMEFPSEWFLASISS